MHPCCALASAPSSRPSYLARVQFSLKGTTYWLPERLCGAKVSNLAPLNAEACRGKSGLTWQVWADMAPTQPGGAVSSSPGLGWSPV